MSVLPSLCTALERVGGDRLVLREGERPHVLVGAERHDVARSALTRAALEALAQEVLSEAGRRLLDETGTITETVQSGESVLTARAERVGDELYVELRRPVTLASDPPGTDARQDGHEDDPAAEDTRIPSISASGGDQPHDYSATMDLDDRTAAAGVREPHGDESDAKGTAAPVLTAANHDAPRAVPLTTAARIAQIVPEIPRVAAGVPDAQVDDSATRNVGEQRAAAAGTGARVRHMPSARPQSDPDAAGLFADAGARGATALYLRAGQPAAARIKERVEPLGSQPVDAGLIARLTAVFDAGGNDEWRPGPDGQWTREDRALGTITCQSFTDHLGRGLVMRFGPPQPPRRLDRQIPRQVRAACDGDGLVVVSAANEAEMLEMATAVADYAGRRRGGYVITLLPAGALPQQISGAFVSQRELRNGDAGAVIRRAAAESPDALLVTPPPDGPAMQAAIHAAAGNRLVVIGLVAPTTTAALRLIASFFTEHADEGQMLSKTFRAGFTHGIVRRLGGGLTHVQDLLVGVAEVRELLAKGDFTGLVRLQRRGLHGMWTADQVLARAVARGHVTLRQASSHTTDRQHLVGLVRTARRGVAPATASGPRYVEIEAQIALDDEPLFATVSR